MILKQIPEDFIVDEIYDIKDFEKKDESSGFYFYFKLTKKNYPQIKAIKIISQIFKVSPKRIHFAGTKDKNAITSQIISIFALKENNFEKNVEYFNGKFEDLNLEFIGKFKGRINLGDNLGNKFTITIRDLTEDDIKLAKTNLAKIKKQGVINYFDEQRFGFAANSHKIGLLILKNEIELAVMEILTSLPPNPSNELKLFVGFIETNWEEIKKSNPKVIDKATELVPPFFREANSILEHLKKAKNDFPGAFRTLHKKLRTLYINAYQSHIFNEIANDCKLDKLPLITVETKIPKQIEKQINEILKKDGITQEYLQLKHMPELRPQTQVTRDCKIFPKKLSMSNVEEDEPNKGKLKLKIEFELGSGEYATNVAKQLFS